MTKPYNFAPWLDNDVVNWSDHWPRTSLPFYSPKNFCSRVPRFSGTLTSSPISSVSHSSSRFISSNEENFDCHENMLHSRSNTFTSPLSKQGMSVPVPRGRTCYRMELPQDKPFDNCWSPLPRTPYTEDQFQDLSPLPCGSSMRRVSFSPLSDDSGFADYSRSSESMESILQSPLETELWKQDVPSLKRKAPVDEDEDLLVSTPWQPLPKQRRVDYFQSNGTLRSPVSTPPRLPHPCANLPKDSLRILPLQKDLDVIFRSIIEVLLCHSDAVSLSSARDSYVSEMKTTSACYSRNILANSERRQDFSRWQTRWGYMYMYLMRHAHLVYHALKQIHLTFTWRSPITYNNWNIPSDQGGLHASVFLAKCQQPGGIISVCAIGGGPGSDLLGLALFLRANNFPVKIRAHVFDKCVDWEESWRDLFRELPPYIADCFESVTFTPFNFFNPTISDAQAEIIRKSDLVTVVKSLSAVAAKLSKTKNVQRESNGLYEILSSVASGCVVLYLDNKAGKQGKVFQQTAKRVPGYQYAMMFYEVSQVQLPSDGFSPSSRHFMNFISYGPSFSSGTNEIVALARKWLIEF